MRNKTYHQEQVPVVGNYYRLLSVVFRYRPD